jgi:DNA-binding response OmpR family regulator
MLNDCKILIANPDKSEVLQLATAFRRNGWNPLSAGDAILTQSIARKEGPSAIVLSSTLPGGGSYRRYTRSRDHYARNRNKRRVYDRGCNRVY